MLGEAPNYTLEVFTQAVRLIEGGARFIATNPDPNGPGDGGTVPACGAVAALIEKASGVNAFFVGKPNPLMMRMALKHIGAHSENTVMVGDRMDTDVIAGVQSGLETILVLSGVTRREDVDRFPYRPGRILEIGRGYRAVRDRATRSSGCLCRHRRSSALDPLSAQPSRSAGPSLGLSSSTGSA